ncbi:hypothetical protein [Streptomyces sp. NPDC051776]|uniref:hypothetical protein n=1 Tax=Streptomyces sp. NPDC051776 TaxID=3155414 RepID=UPI003443B6F9
MSGFVDELGRCADEVGDDREEAFVECFLICVGSGFALGLGQGGEAVVVPGEGEGFGAAESVRGLFGEGGSVPGEVSFFEDGLLVVGEALLGGAAS